MNIEADVIFYGGSAGSGKSHLLLMRQLRYKDDKDFNGIYFRRNTQQLDGQGGLWEEAQKMYSPFNPSYRQKGMKVKFPSGCSCQFSHMEHEKDRKKHQGLQYTFVGMDELTHFTETQFTYLLSRLRSESETKSFFMATLNPENDSWVLNWVEHYLNDDGLFNEELLGRLSYYAMVDEQPVFRWSEEEIREEFPEACRDWNPVEGEWVDLPPKSFIFIGSTIYDNPALIKKNPGYLQELNSLKEVEKQRLLYGNWYAREKASAYFDRDWLHKIERAPAGISARAWDKASEEPSTKEMKPDFTASVKMIKDRSGHYTVVGDYIDTNADENTKGLGYLYRGRFRKRPGPRDTIIEDQGIADGVECTVVLPIDPAAAGKVEYQQSAKKLIEAGLRVKSDPMPNNKSKLTKFSPVSSAAENGLVSIVESSFPDKKTLNEFYKEWESFDGERSTRDKKDDLADAFASVFNYLAQARVVKLVSRNQQRHRTSSADFLESKRVNNS